MTKKYYNHIVVGFAICALGLAMMGCSKDKDDSKKVSEFLAEQSQQLYANRAVERKVKFSALYKSEYSNIEDFKSAKVSLQRYTLPELAKYIFGPLTYNEIGAPQKGEKIVIDESSVKLVDGKVQAEINYSGIWLINKSYKGAVTLELPFPYNQTNLITGNWKACTDSDPDHQTAGFFWYFWEPTRYGCDHKLGKEFQTIAVELGAETIQTEKSYPQYDRMIRTENSEKVVAMTFAFGYVDDKSNPQPFKDSDAGMYEFRKFVSYLQKQTAALDFKTEPVKLGEYDSSEAENVIGQRFVGVRNGITYKITAVTSAGVDQMDLFAKSFAKDHESFFGWFGHSRVGSGFDANQFENILVRDPNQFSMTSEYQIIYWAGCNSYSYYSNPFFDLKSKLDLKGDPRGTKNLDIISNGLPSLFSFNAANAAMTFEAMFNPEKNLSYQQIVNQIENYAKRNGIVVLVNILGDEDNK